MALNFFDSTDWFATGATVTCTATWKNGDTVLVWGQTENNPITLGTPSATGLGSWQLVGSILTTGESNAYLWSAVATADGTAATISSAKTGAGQGAIAAWVHAGPVASITALTGNNTEAAYAAVSVPAGGYVVMGVANFTATTPNKTPLTGSGTATERVDVGTTQNAGAAHGAWLADWQNTAAGSFSFGPNDYTSLQVSQVGAVITPLYTRSLYAVSTAGTATGTQVSSSLPVKAGKQLLVVGSALRNGHSNGLDAAWADPATNATLNTITWTQVALGTQNGSVGATFEIQLVAWISSLLTSDESITVTIDAQSGGASTFFYAMEVLEVTPGPNGSSWGSKQNATGNGPATSGNPVFGVAPTAGNLQLVTGYGLGTGGVTAITWAAPPTNFVLVPGAETSIVGETEMNVVGSIINVATSITWSWTNTGGSALATSVLAIELQAVAGASASLSQTHFRFGADDGSESAHTFVAAEDVNVNLSIGDARLLRIQVDETAGTATTLSRPTWQYKQVGDPDSEYRDIKP